VKADTAARTKVVLCGLVLLRDDEGVRLGSGRPAVWSTDDLSSRVSNVDEGARGLLAGVRHPCLSVAVDMSDLEGQRWRGCAGCTVKVGHVPVGIA